MAGRVNFMALEGFPETEPGDDLATLIAAALDAGDNPPAPRDILVVAQKIVSKAEGRYVDLATMRPSPRACDLAAT
ncbi:MAG TPA: coenzyme F420-0:L-glutamate ligase, partial [Kiloniellales bacterium]